MLRALIFAALTAGAFGAALPEPYRTVDRIVFVVPDVAKAASAWTSAGVPAILPRTVKLFQTSGEPLRVRMATVQFQNVTADFIEPITAKGVFYDFLRTRRGGVYALVHRFPTSEALEAELDRLRALGVKRAADTSWRDGILMDRCVYLDTAEQGKYALALAVTPDRKPVDTTRRVVQYAFVVKDLEAVSSYWVKLGFPPMTYSRPDSSELVYRGQPGKFEMRQGWQRHGTVVYEWLQPLRGPSIYEDHLVWHGDGFHHLAFNVDDMDEANDLWDEFGLPLVMSGAWGKKGEPGSGRFAYHDAEVCCGIDVELLWEYKAQTQ